MPFSQACRLYFHTYDPYVPLLNAVPEITVLVTPGNLSPLTRFSCEFCADTVAFLYRQHRYEAIPFDPEVRGIHDGRHDILHGRLSGKYFNFDISAIGTPPALPGDL
jgi:hypothetical protein